MTVKLRTICGAATAVLALTLAMPAHAHSNAGQMALALEGGLGFPIDGTMHGGANVDIANLGILNPALDGIPATLQIGERSQDDVYGRNWSIGAELSYGLSTNAELFGAFRYQEADGGRINVGQAVAGAPVNASLPVFGDFSDYKSLSGEIGVRYYMAAESTVSPYVAGRIGMARISEITSTFTVPDAGISLPDTPFSDSSWVLSAGADIGVSIRLSENVYLQPEVGLHYQDGPSGNDSALGGLGLASINDFGSRLTVPVRVRARFGF